MVGGRWAVPAQGPQAGTVPGATPSSPDAIRTAVIQDMRTLGLLRQGGIFRRAHPHLGRSRPVRTTASATLPTGRRTYRPRRRLPAGVPPATTSTLRTAMDTGPIGLSAHASDRARAGTILGRGPAASLALLLGGRPPAAGRAADGPCRCFVRALFQIADLAFGQFGGTGPSTSSGIRMADLHHRSGALEGLRDAGVSRR